MIIITDENTDPSTQIETVVDSVNYFLEQHSCLSAHWYIGVNKNGTWEGLVDLDDRSNSRGLLYTIRGSYNTPVNTTRQQIC